MTRGGQEEPLPLPVNPYAVARLSPDGTKLSVLIATQDNLDVWTSEVGRNTLSGLPTDSARDTQGVWTPDGEHVVFVSDRAGAAGLFVRTADGTGEVLPLVTAQDFTNLTLRPGAWSPDGQHLVFNYSTGAGSDVGVVALGEEPRWEPLITTGAGERGATLSPDGAWVAYVSNETGQQEVYVQRFPDGGQRQVDSNGGGVSPLWSPAGRELFYISGSALLRVPVEDGATFGAPEPLIASTDRPSGRFRIQDVSPDSQRFLAIRTSATASEGAPPPPPQIVVVQNWLEELKARVPSGQ